MRGIVKKLLSVIVGMGIFLSGVGIIPPGKVEATEIMKKEEAAGYLAVYVASYEHNMGVEYAQFPSNRYTDTCRTDVLYYGLSKDGVDFEGLNNDKAVYYPKGFYQLGSPSVFRKPDGTYGLIASINNSDDSIFLSDSKDMISFNNERVKKLNDKNIIVKNPTVEYRAEDNQYCIYWEGGDNNSYVTTTGDFEKFSEPQICDYHKEKVEANLPCYASSEEAAIMELTKEEYDRINKKFGKVHSVAIEDIPDVVVKEGDKVELPKNVDVKYSDGSTASMGVEWDVSDIGTDINHMKEGTYKIKGTVKNSSYNSPLAKFRADPFVLYNQQDGMYYLTGSNLNEKSAAGGGAYSSIVLRRAKTINGLSEAEETNIWTNKSITVSANRKDSITSWYWAPEIHFIGGKWRIIAMGTVVSKVDNKKVYDGWAQCIFTCEGDDLMNKNNWKYDGYIGDTTDKQKVGAFDTTFFEYGGKCYYVTPRDTKIYITTVDPDDLTKPTGPRVEISKPDRAFERNLGSKQDIEEGPAVLLHDGKVFVTYSCATVDMHYGVCLLYADLNDDLMKASSWNKYQAPLLTTADLTTTVKEGEFTQDTTKNGEYKGIFGPGHNSFTVDENGNPVIVYHARDWDDSYPGATGDNKYGLTDPGRHAYVNSVHFGADGFPIFNMSSEQILSEDLKDVSVTVRVEEDAVLTSDNGDGTFSNPVIFSDVPDEDIIRVGDAYYMISTTMHLSPGAPIMKSYDLVNWEIVNYVYDYLETDDERSLKNNKSDYANGQWAASLRYDKYQKKYYVTFSCQTTPKSYFFVTDDIENGSWHRSETTKCYDSSFLFVDTGTECKKYMIIPVSKQGKKTDGSTYTYNQTEMCELIVDENTWDVSLSNERTLLIDNNNVENPPAGLAAEGVHAYKIGEYYYFFMIQGAGNPVRQQICWRSKTLEHGSFEVKKVFTGGIVDTNGKTVNSSWGVAQGGIVQTPQGDWYSIMFEDYHSVGRIPVLVPVSFDKDGWPVFGNDGKSVNKVLPMPIQGYKAKSIVKFDGFENGTRKIYDASKKDATVTAGIPVEQIEANLDRVNENEFGYNGSNLNPVWQWNHNPNNNLWSLTEREGYLRLKSGIICKNIRKARNTLTQRTFGPTSVATTAIEVVNMKNGDVAGLSAFQNQYGFAGVKMMDGKKYLVMHRATKAGDGAGKEQECVELTQDRVYLKVACDYREKPKTTTTWRMRDEAYFYYSLDGENWTKIGDTLKMNYDWPDFMGYRFGLFYYSTAQCGGYVDFDYFDLDYADGKKSEFQKMIKQLPEIQKQPSYTDKRWEEYTKALEETKSAVSSLPEDESALTLAEIEENYESARLCIQKVNVCRENLVKPDEKETATPTPPATVPTATPTPPVTVPTATQTATPTPTPAIPEQPEVPDKGISSRKVTVKAAGYPFLKKDLYLTKGTKVKLRAEVSPVNATKKKVIYTSNKPKTAAVSSKGVIKAVKPGTAKITIQAEDGAAKKVITVNVVKKKKKNKVLKAAKKTIFLKKGSTAEFPLKKQTAKTTSRVIYKSLKNKVASVDPFGRIRAKKKGTAKVKAICGKKSVVVKVRVTK